MVPLVPCRSTTTCASRLNYIHSCLSDLQRRFAWISAVMFHSSRRHDVKTTVAVLCLPSSGSTASSYVYCRQASLPTPAHNDLPSRVTSSLVLHRHSRLKTFPFSVHTRASTLDFHFLIASVDLAVGLGAVCANYTSTFIRNNQICYRNFNVRHCCK